MKNVSLTFDRDHTHAGAPIARGETRELSAHDADWLIAQGVAHATRSTTRERPVRRDTTEEHNDVH